MIKHFTIKKCKSTIKLVDNLRESKSFKTNRIPSKILRGIDHRTIILETFIQIIPKKIGKIRAIINHIKLNENKGNMEIKKEDQKKSMINSKGKTHIKLSIQKKNLQKHKNGAKTKFNKQLPNQIYLSYKSISGSGIIKSVLSINSLKKRGQIPEKNNIEQLNSLFVRNGFFPH